MEQLIDLQAKIRANEALFRQLNQFAPALAKKIMRKAARKAAKPLLDAARSFAPVETGALRKGIKIRSVKRKRSSQIIGVKVQTPTREQLGIPEDASHYYPAVLEYGTSEIPARSYMRNARDAAERDVYRTYRIEIQYLLAQQAMETLRKQKSGAA